MKTIFTNRKESVFADSFVVICEEVVLPASGTAAAHACCADLCNHAVARE